MPKLRILRGLPGSGKSTLAKTFNTVHLESDQFLITDGKYLWTPERLQAGIEKMYELVCQCVDHKIDVTISGVFSKRKAFKRYVDLAEKHGYDLTVIKCCNDFGNIHDVPTNILENMKNIWQDFEGEEIFQVGV